jgi:deoxyribodipyrimidine photolyase-related protein
VRAITLIFPHQLFDPHPAVAPGRPVLLVEDSLFFGDARNPAVFHTHKLLLHRSAMAAYRRRLDARGVRVALRPYRPDETVSAVVADLARDGVGEVHVADPEDFLLEKRLRASAARHGIALRLHPSPMFLTDPAWADALFAKHGRHRMAEFYQAQRRRLGILMDGGKPAGGAWSFDAENRKPLPRGLAPPPVSAFRYDALHQECARGVERAFPAHPGAVSDFWFPVTHEQAWRGLDEFLEHRFARFGDYEDAISARHTVVFHSVLTPALNIGLLTPDTVVNRALSFARARRVPLNAVEGFIRQIIGWREFIRLMYRREGVRMRTSNFWNHTRPLPKSFYDGTTGLAPFDLVVRRVRREAYCHHIERLMVAGNLMVLCGIHPDAAYRWFMELFIDAYDWVMVPNVYGMALFADGGLFATKPYISGSAYLRRMSDIPAGPWCATWDALFWRFIATHRAVFLAHPRLSMMARTWDNLAPEKQRTHLRHADAFLARLE